MSARLRWGMDSSRKIDTAAANPSILSNTPVACVSLYMNCPKVSRTRAKGCEWADIAPVDNLRRRLDAARHEPEIDTYAMRLFENSSVTA